jgi:DNA-binding LacI/PurR family transcriptional regulator
MSDKAVSINDVAKMAGVSPATVSNAITGRKKVSAELARKVEAAVKALEYRPDPLASTLRSGDARIVAVLVPDLDNPFFTSIVSAVEYFVGADSYEVIVASSRGEDAVECAKLKAILAWRPAGLIVIPSTDEFLGRDIIDAFRTPYVIADRTTGNPNADTVSIDNEGAGAIGADHLIALGHRNVLIAASSLRLANIRQRCAGAAKAFAEHGLPKPEVVELGLDTDAACQRLSQWFDRNRAPTAIQALTNFTTLSVLTAAAERGRQIPKDISLLGFDDYAWMSARATPLTAICQPVREMGRALWERLGARIRGEVSPPVHVQFACELRVRASTAAPHLEPLERRSPSAPRKRAQGGR